MADKVRAAIAVSNPYDLEVTSLKLQKTSYGLYDWSIKKNLMKAYKHQ